MSDATSGEPSGEIPILAHLFDSLPVGVILLDRAGRVVVYNSAEERLAGRARSSVLGKDFFADVAPCMNVRELGGRFRESIGRSPLDVVTEFSFPFPFLEQPRDVLVRMRSLEARGEPFGMLMVEDVSLQRSIERMRDTLQSLLVHDLKNPLAVIVSSLGFLASSDLSQDLAEREEAIGDGLVAAERLQGMLLNLLDVTRLETQTFPVSRKRTDLAALIVEAGKAYRGQARARGAELIVDADAASPLEVDADAPLLRRAIDNLVENAFRHARRVVLRAAIEGNTALVEVEDDGPGVPAEVRDSIFEKYAQVRDDGGVQTSLNRGLGLTFVRLALRAHHGDATVRCPERGGSTFRLEFPVRAT